MPIFDAQHGIFHNFTRDGTHQVRGKLSNTKPFDLFAMLSERFLEHALMLRDVVEHVLRL